MKYPCCHQKQYCRFLGKDDRLNKYILLCSLPKPTQDTKRMFLRNKFTRTKNKITATKFWKLESRWTSGNWLNRPWKWNPESVAGEAKKQSDFNTNPFKRLRNWWQQGSRRGVKVRLKTGRLGWKLFKKQSPRPTSPFKQLLGFPCPTLALLECLCILWRMKPRISRQQSVGRIVWIRNSKWACIC